MFPATIPLINGPYFSTNSAGITASPGDSIAGTISPAPLGPGTLTIPFANFLAPFRGIIIPGLLSIKAWPALVALWYAAINFWSAAASAVKLCVSFACDWSSECATAAASSCSVFKYWVCSSRICDWPVSFRYPWRKIITPLSPFAIALAIKPNVIKKIGPIAPIPTVKKVISFLLPSERLLNFSKTPATNSTIGVAASKNDLPTGTSASLRSSTLFLNLFIAESAVIPNSCSDKEDNSSTDEFAKARTREAWFPSFVTFAKSAERRANWNFPNICSIACALFNGSNALSASANSITVALRSPLFFVTISLALIPKAASISDALPVGLINAARPDLSALAPSDALIPPSFIAAMKNVKSFTSPPSCWITGATFGIAVVMSSRDTTVWFSTALRKFIESASLSEDIPKAFCNEIVVSRAFCVSIWPRIESRVASVVWRCKSKPWKPAAAASAAKPTVVETAIPYCVKLFPNSVILSNAAWVSAFGVNKSP